MSPDINAIRARDREGANWQHSAFVHRQAYRDRRALLAEVERLSTEPAALVERAEAAYARGYREGLLDALRAATTPRTTRKARDA